MTIEILPTAPNREELRALYDEAVNEINTLRPTIDLTTGFYAETADSVFDACCLALSDSCKGTKGPQRMHVVSAPAGGGKTSFSYAFMVALTQYAENDPEAPYGCVFVVDQIKKADEAYRELNALMPGKVAVWTTEHDRGCKKRTRLPNPAAKFTRDELRKYPIIVVTHTFYNGPKGNKAHLVVRNGTFQNNRALIIVDERPEEVDLYEVTLKEYAAR
jgi:Type III restriction enzyme, res subunit